MKLGKFLLGLGVGAAAGLLLAPKKGSELREDLKNESVKAYDNLKNLTKEDVEAMLGQTIETVKKSIDEFDVEDFKASTKEKLADLQTTLEEYASKVKDTEEYLIVKENIIEITEKLNKKLDEVKTKIQDSEMKSIIDFDAFEDEIEDVEEKLEEMISEIKD